MADQEQKQAWPLAERVAMLVDGTITALITGTIIAIALAAMHLPFIQPALIISWLALGTVITSSRLILHILYRKNHERFSTQAWLRIFLAGIFFSGVFWGLAGGVVFPQNTAEHAAFTAFALVGLCAGALNTYTTVPFAFALFAVPTLLPFIARLLIHNDPDFTLIAGMVGIFMIALLFTSHRVYRALGAMLRLRSKNAELEYQARRDGLVDLLNHREFRRQLDNIIEEDPTLLDGCGLIFVDLDGFKQVNDTAGHLVGDQLLCQIADVLKISAGDAAIAARLGGDEFGLLLHPIQRGQVMTVAEEIRQAIADTEVNANGQPNRVEASIGVAFSRGKTVSSADLLSAADEACYFAKANGRNQVRLHMLSDTEKVTKLADHRRATHS
jgi:diguanylate cyclase (GGDEF)-like protein